MSLVIGMKIGEFNVDYCSVYSNLNCVVWNGWIKTSRLGFYYIILHRTQKDLIECSVLFTCIITTIFELLLPWYFVSMGETRPCVEKKFQSKMKPWTKKKSWPKMKPWVKLKLGANTSSQNQPLHKPS